MRYFKRDVPHDNISYLAQSDEIEITVFKSCVHIDNSIMGENALTELEYKPITRTEFMEAYLPIAEKMNNKIGEL